MYQNQVSGTGNSGLPGVSEGAGEVSKVMRMV